MIEYKGYQAVIEFNDEAKIFHGEAINTHDVITFQGTTVDELETEFKASVDVYLAFCQEHGRKPERP